jgi:hypothetical protein
MASEPSNPRVRGSKSNLTPKQRRLIAEFEEIAASVGMDYWNILEYREDGRTAMLEVMKRQLISSVIISRYSSSTSCCPSSFVIFTLPPQNQTPASRSCGGQKNFVFHALFSR